jgi:hypothetical protein
MCGWGGSSSVALRVLLPGHCVRKRGRGRRGKGGEGKIRREGGLSREERKRTERKRGEGRE